MSNHFTHIDAAHAAKAELVTWDDAEVLKAAKAAGVTLEPGQQVVVQVITANTGQVIPELIVRYLPETLANLSALQATT